MPNRQKENEIKRSHGDLFDVVEVTLRHVSINKAFKPKIFVFLIYTRGRTDLTYSVP